jgi:N-acetylmuramoyl-L-alanine amidase
LLEKTLTLDVSKRLQQILARQGFVVTLTRTRDVTLPLDRRVAIAKELRADLFVSVHFNAEARGRDARGIETYCLTPSGSASTASSRSLGSYLAGNRFDDRNMLLAYSV